MIAEKARAPGEGLRRQARTATAAEIAAAASNGSVYGVVCMFNPFPSFSYAWSLHWDEF
jgi:hypothetical protein